MAWKEAIAEFSCKAMLPYCLLSTEVFHKLTAVADSQKPATLSKSFFSENVSSLYSSPYGRGERKAKEPEWPYETTSPQKTTDCEKNESQRLPGKRAVICKIKPVVGPIFIFITPAWWDGESNPGKIFLEQPF